MKVVVYGCAVLVLVGMASQTFAAKRTGSIVRRVPSSQLKPQQGLAELIQEGLSQEQGACVLEVRERLKDSRQPLRAACGSGETDGFACDEAKVGLETAQANAREQIVNCLR
jgi:hypothetical protein